MLPSSRRRAARPAASSTVGLNLAVLAFCLLVGALAVRYGRARARGPADLRWLAVVLAVLATFLLVNAAAAWLGLRAVRAAATTPAITSARTLAAARAGDQVVVAGRVSPEAESDDPRYPAYFRCWTGCVYHGSSPLPITLDGGEALLANSDYERRRWRVVEVTEEEWLACLDRESPVVVVGTVSPTVNPPGSSRPVEALLVYAGTHGAFAAQARRSQALALSLLLLDLAGALSAAVSAGLTALGR